MKRKPPITPNLGISPEQASALYPQARKVRSKRGYPGIVLCAASEEEQVHLVFEKERLVEIVFDTSWRRGTEKSRRDKLSYFLDAYGGESKFKVVLDNGFGYTLVRKDKLVSAMYAYQADVFTATEMASGEIAYRDWDVG